MSATVHISEPAPNDELRMAPLYERSIQILRLGAIVTFALLGIGIALVQLRGETLPARLDSFGDILSALRRRESVALIDLAIVSAMLTPVVLVLSLAIGFYRIGDRRYALLSLFVLAILCVSIILGLFR